MQIKKGNRLTVPFEKNILEKVDYSIPTLTIHSRIIW